MYLQEQDARSTQPFSLVSASALPNKISCQLDYSNRNQQEVAIFLQLTDAFLNSEFEIVSREEERVERT